MLEIKSLKWKIQMEFEQLVDTFRMKTSSDGDGVLTWPFSQGLVQIWTRFGRGLVRFGCGLVWGLVWGSVWGSVWASVWGWVWDLVWGLVVAYESFRRSMVFIFVH